MEPDADAGAGRRCAPPWRKFARKRGRPGHRRLYGSGASSRTQIVAKMGAMGLFGLPIAEEYGGIRRGTTSPLCLALEELARVDSSVAITLEAGVSLGAMPIYRFGTEAQKQLVAASSGGRRETGCVRPY